MIVFIKCHERLEVFLRHYVNSLFVLSLRYPHFQISLVILSLRFFSLLLLSNVNVPISRRFPVFSWSSSQCWRTGKNKIFALTLSYTGCLRYPWPLILVIVDSLTILRRLLLNKNVVTLSAIRLMIKCRISYVRSFYKITEFYFYFK